MKKYPLRQPLFAAVALVGAVTVPVMVQAASNPFSNTELASGFNLQHAIDTKAGGEGKCGDAVKCPEGKCGEGKCGEKCAKKEGDNVVAGQAVADKDAEGKCGEGKCGENHSEDSKAKK